MSERKRKPRSKKVDVKKLVEEKTTVAAEKKQTKKTGKKPAPPPPPEPDQGMQKQEDLSEDFADVLDRSIHATIAQFTKGISPGSLANAYWDWISHMSINQGKQMQLAKKGFENSLRLSRLVMKSGHDSSENMQARDNRFRDEAWQSFPFNIYAQAFMLNQEWWKEATTNVRGVSKKHEDIVEFMSRQVLDVLSPSNYIMTNPVLLDKIRSEGGANLIRGLNNFLEDLGNMRKGGAATEPGSEKYRVGETLAATPGKVIFRNRLIELIQYEPKTKKVHPEPVLVVPAWIMKYYILDLSQHNSVVKYLIEQGYTVFIISWKNPDSGDRDLGMEDYLRDGVQAALDVVKTVVPDQQVHGAGYCLGGTLLAIFAAVLARDKIETFKTLTFLAAQVDFTEAGELTLFIDDSQLTFLEDMMWEQGYLDAEQMAGAFQLLRSNDLIWSRMLRDYLMGERMGMNDIMAWNADATRMPYRMHSEYLRQLFLNNDLAEGRYKIGRRPVAVSDIRAPLFCVGTQKDHVAPWRSVYKFHSLTDTDVTFLLTNGGHNAGIVSEPGHKGRRYQVATRKFDETFIDPETWARETPFTDGSWWPEWVKWLKQYSGTLVSPPGIGGTSFKPVCDAPGEYVYLRY